jgi:aspartyl-tRNA(Asn)/glutamyl-tRNA(Gln) amidotransferase subunit C
MSKISESEVQKLAKLARVGLTAEEISLLAVQMSEILEYAEDLDKVDISGVLPTSQVTGLYNVYREDEILPIQCSRDDLLENAPAVSEGSIKVKAVL